MTYQNRSKEHASLITYREKKNKLNMNNTIIFMKHKKKGKCQKLAINILKSSKTSCQSNLHNFIVFLSMEMKIL